MLLIFLAVIIIMLAIGLGNRLPHPEIVKLVLLGLSVLLAAAGFSGARGSWSIGWTVSAVAYVVVVAGFLIQLAATIRQPSY